LTEIPNSTMLETLDKAENGSIVDEKIWDSEIIGAISRELISKYKIAWSKDDPGLPADDEFADRLYAAGLEFAQRTGVYCLDTKRRMEWGREELQHIADDGPTAIEMGAGEDTCLVYKRRPDDDLRTAVFGGPWGVSVPEEHYPKYIEAYAREPIFDLVENAMLLSTQSRPIRAGSPWEAVAAWQESQLARAAAERAGRPGVALGCVELATTEIGELAGTTYGAYRPTDIHHAALISEQKTAYHQLTKVVHFAQTGCLSETYFNPMFGGYLGGGPGTALGIVSGSLLSKACHGGELINSGPTHVHLDCSTHPDQVFATSLAFQALTRNTNLMVTPFVRPTAGPGTREIFWEAGALTIAAVVSGASVVDVVQSATGNHVMHATPLEARFCGELVHAVRGMSRADANALVTWMIDQYRDIQKQRLIGRSFLELYDLETLEPLPEWQTLYDDARQELSAFGLNLQKEK
jgi:methylamine---corrinoid protein Co-methyltransferase